MRALLRIGVMQEVGMFQSWRVGNFKSIAQPVSLKMAPLTLLVGANSSGKSTLLQSILAGVQTLASPATERAFILNGEYVKLGSLADMLHQGRVDAPFEFGFDLRITPGLLTNAARSSIESDALSTPSEIEVCVDALCLPTALPTADAPRLVLGAASLATRSARISIKRQEVQRQIGLAAWPPELDGFGMVELAFPTDEDQPYSSITEPRVGVEHFLPSFIWEPYNLVVEQVKDALGLYVQYLTKSDVPPWVLARLDRLVLDSRAGREFGISLRNVLRSLVKRDPTRQGFELAWQLTADMRTAGEWFRKAPMQLNSATIRDIVQELRQERAATVKRLEEDATLQHEIGFRRRRLPNSLETARTGIVDYFTKRIWYLGPLRDNPRAIYELPPVPEDADVGLRGEYTASVLQHHHSDLVLCPLPEEGLRSQEMPLGKAVSRWLVHMDLVENVATSDRGKFGTELSLHLSHVDRSLDLTNVGVGVSQVLPSIVMGLLAPVQSTLLMEQPELHLHPKVQASLGDFLIGLALSGRQCIVETHSEYLVNRLRRRIAEASGSSLQSLIQLYFVERIDGRSEFRSVVPNEYGAIADWPKGFFDQGPDEAQLIIQAATAKRQAKIELMERSRKVK